MKIATLHPARVPTGKIFILPIVFFLLFAVFAVGHLLQKPGLRPGEVYQPFAPVRVNLDGVDVQSEDELEFLLNGHRIGDEVLITPDQSPTGTVPVTLVRYFSPWSVAFDAVMALIILLVGVVVLMFHPDRRVASVFMWATITLGVSLLGTRTLCNMDPGWLGTGFCIIFFLGFSTLPVIFIHFTSVFPVRKTPRTRLIVSILYPLATLMAAWQAVVYLEAAATHSIALFREANTAFAWMNGFMVAGILTGLTLLVRSYLRANTLSERKKTAWILYGLIVGTLPFALLWALPQVFNSQPVIPEFLFKVFLLAIPLSFAISILQYRLVDISTLISRSAVHALVIGTLVVLYAILIGITAGMVSGWTVERSILYSAAAAVIAVVTYDWIRKWAERLVDRSIFRISADWRGSLKELLENLKNSTDLEQMTGKLISGVNRLLSVERIALFSLEQPGNRLHTLAERNFPLLRRRGVRFEPEHLKSTLELPVAVDDHIERNVPHENADTVVFGRWGISLAIPMKSKGGTILGFLVLGRRKDGLRFTEEDVDLLTVVAGEAAGEKERLDLRDVAKHLEELNQLKSYFVSSVSHDLKTPLASIKMFADLLRSKKDSLPEKDAQFLNIIAGETERLKRMVDNILDFSKIEKGIKEYHYRETSLNDIVERLMVIMEYQCKMAKCETERELADGPLALIADPDAILEALMNLVGNALKYSDKERKRISIVTREAGDHVTVSVADNGVGIDPGEVDNIFQPFHRLKDEKTRSQGGAGLGLSVVKDIVEAHHGTITVESEPGRGSTFTILLPVEQSADKGEERS